MRLKQGILWLCLIITPAHAGLLDPLAGEKTSPEEWVAWIHYLETIEQRLQNEVALSIERAQISIDTNPNAIYDHKAFLDGKYQVEWNSGQTGELPGPEKSRVRANIEGENSSQNFLATYEAVPFQNKIYYKTALNYSISDLKGKPVRRGFAEIFRDISKQQTKISTSFIEGPSDILPEAMMQINLQAIFGPEGYLFLRQDRGIPTRTAQDQKHFCRTPSGGWVEEKTAEWEKHCAPLFDGGYWHGFSFTMIPNSYDGFLETRHAKQ